MNAFQSVHPPWHTLCNSSEQENPTLVVRRASQLPAWALQRKVSQSRLPIIVNRFLPEHETPPARAFFVECTVMATGRNGTLRFLCRRALPRIRDSVSSRDQPPTVEVNDG